MMKLIKVLKYLFDNMTEAILSYKIHYKGFCKIEILIMFYKLVNILSLYNAFLKAIIYIIFIAEC